MSIFKCNHVSYSYDKNTNVLKDITFSFELGKVYAILFIELQNEKSEANIQVIAKNGMADLIYRKFEIESNILIEGYIQKTQKNLIVVIRNVEKLENGEMDKK